MDYSLLSSHQLDRFFHLISEASAFVRLLAFFLVWLLLWLPLAIPLAIALRWQPGQPISASQKLPLVASLYVLAPVVLWGESILEKVPLTEYGLVWRVTALSSLFLGLILGVLGLVVMLVVQQRLGWLQVRSLGVAESEATGKPKATQHLIPTLFSTLAIALWISFAEELVFRGFLPNQLQRDYPSWLAITIASLIFALLHLVWEGQETLPQLPGLWLMGVVLSIARWTDQGSLGLAIGLHTGWIWTIASLDTAQLLHYTGKGPEWVTGLDGKPLAGLIGLLCLLITAAILIGTRNLHLEL